VLGRSAVIRDHGLNVRRDHLPGSDGLLAPARLWDVLTGQQIGSPPDQTLKQQPASVSTHQAKITKDRGMTL